MGGSCCPTQLNLNFLNFLSLNLMAQVTECGILTWILGTSVGFSTVVGVSRKLVRDNKVC